MLLSLLFICFPYAKQRGKNEEKRKHTLSTVQWHFHASLLDTHNELFTVYLRDNFMWLFDYEIIAGHGAYVTMTVCQQGVVCIGSMYKSGASSNVYNGNGFHLFTVLFVRENSMYVFVCYLYNAELSSRSAHFDSTIVVSKKQITCCWKLLHKYRLPCAGQMPSNSIVAAFDLLSIQATRKRNTNNGQAWSTF